MEPQWVNYFSQLPTIVGASNDTTGNIKYGGNFILESTSEDIEFIYFTTNIKYYTYLLDFVTDSSNFVIVKKDGYYISGNTIQNYKEVNLSNVRQIVTTGSYSMDLQTDGTLWGLIK